MNGRFILLSFIVSNIKRYEEEIESLKLTLESIGAPVSRGIPASLKFHPMPQLETELQAVGNIFSGPLTQEKSSPTTTRKRSIEAENSRNIKPKTSISSPEEEANSGILEQSNSDLFIYL